MGILNLADASVSGKMPVVLRCLIVLGCIFPWALTNVFTAFSPKTARVLPENGGDDGNRTHDPLLAGQVLSQLSYTPIRARLR